MCFRYATYLFELAFSFSLQIEKERLFSDISRILAAASDWEERTTQVLTRDAPMSSFEDAIRTSESIYAILPSFDTIQDAFTLASSWLKKSEPFLVANSSMPPTLRALLEVEDLKEVGFTIKASQDNIEGAINASNTFR